MTDAFITQCPHCQTSFRIKRSQLDATQETVRCGACLQEYNAASQFNSSTIKQATPQHIAQQNPAITLLSTTTAKALPAPSQTAHLITQLSMIDNVIALSNLDDFDREYEQERLEWDLHHPREALEKSIDGPAAASQPQPQPQPYTQARRLENTGSSNPVFLEHQSSATDHATTLNVEAVEQTELDEDSFNTQAKPFTAFTTESTAEYANHFTDEPLRLDWQPTKKPWKRWHMWSLLNVLAVLLLLSQYTYNNFTELARQNNTRPLLEALCPILGCQLPAKVDVEQIKSSNLVIRSHAEFRGALQVDAIIYNRAPFSQPFPLLELTFSDPNGEHVISRQFKPDEYLSGELAGQNNMPQQVPIHIALEILEPSGETLNYSLKFVSPD